MTTQTLIRMVLGLSMTAVVGLFAARRVLWLYKLIMSGQPVSGRTDDLGTRIWTQIAEVFGQRKLLKWSLPGLAHFFTMWGFFILLTVYIEAYGVLFQPNFHLPIIGRWDALGALQDFFALAVLTGIITFAIIRLRSEPKEYGRQSRFYGSHTGGAWLILFMIFNVIWTYAIFRGASVNALATNSPTARALSSRTVMGALMAPLGQHTNEIIETVALMLHIAVMLAFLLIVLHSKHLHIFLAPINVTFKRLPDGLGPLLPVESDGKPIDFENPPDDAEFGRGKIEDFTWKAMLDFATCTECGRCQSQCPAWNTGKPLSPKLVIMDLRDHWMAKAPYILGEKTAEPLEGLDLETVKEEGHHVPESGFGRVPGHGPEQAARPLVGTAEQGGVIDPDVLWSCVTCGACVEQCPVDIEHIDHIVDMRRYQVMMESEFPVRAVHAVQEPGNQGQPVGAERLRPDQLDRRGRLRRPGLRRGRRELRRLRVPVLGGLRGRLRRQGQEDHQGRRRTARHRRGEVPGAGHRGNLQRRLGTPLGQRVPVPAAGPAGRRDPGRAVRGRGDRRPQDRRHLPALLQHDSARNTGSWAPTTACCTTPSCSTGWCATRSWFRSPRSPRTSPITTRATWAGTTRCTRRRAS